MRYIEPPLWGKKLMARGASGTEMTVTLGPDAILRENYGSPTGQTSLNQCMSRLNLKDYTLRQRRNGSAIKRGLWVAGHLLNDNLGGPGNRNENLTPLTQTANKQHAVYENRIKNALTIAERLTRFNADNPYIIGVFYEVKVSDVNFGDHGAYRYAPSHITLTIKLKKYEKPKNDLTDLVATDYAAFAGLTQNDAAHLALLPGKTVQIDNDDSHLLACSNRRCNH